MKIEYQDELLLDTILEKNDTEIAYRKINGQLTIINLKRNTFNVLNEVAARLWELIDGQTSLEQILKKVYEDFDIDWLTLNQDCFSFVYEMLDEGLLLNSGSAKETFSQLEFNEPEKGLFDNLREKAIVQKIPIIAHFDLTYNCNLNCIHCYIVNNHHPILKIDEVKDVLEQLAKAGVLYLTISGGEVLTRDDFFEIAQHARKLHFALRILTNGTLIDEVNAEKIASLNPEMVAISIYSTNPQVHDRITRIPGSFKKSISAAKMLRKKDVRLKISTVIMKQNIDDYHAIYELSRQLGATFQADYRISPKTDGNKTPLEVHIDKKHVSSLLADPIFTEKSESEPQELYLGIFNTVPCGAGHMSCYITPYGDVYPCVQLTINCGNLKESSFADIWGNSSQLSEFRSITISKLTSCSQCEFFNYCRICVGLNYVEEGSIFSPSRRACQEAKIMKVLGRKRR
ncbi:MAG: PqqD family peptide modification chaperone [Candidatus Paceibacterota bacterium]